MESLRKCLEHAKSTKNKFKGSTTKWTKSSMKTSLKAQIMFATWGIGSQLTVLPLSHLRKFHMSATPCDNISCVDHALTYVFNKYIIHHHWNACFAGLRLRYWKVLACQAITALPEGCKPHVKNIFEQHTAMCKSGEGIYWAGWSPCFCITHRRRQPC
jgi:hypothetical protein